MIIVGLGNPTKEYQNTLHNLGFMAVDLLSERLAKKIKSTECQSQTAFFSMDGETIVLAKPQTFMNLSGIAVKSLLKKYNHTPDNLIVIYDDFDIPKFSIRVRKDGSAGTHNGMRDIVKNLQSTDFKRIRIGIGSTLQDKKDFVLSQISKKDLEEFGATLNRLTDALITYIKDRDFDLLMRTLN